MGIYKYIQKLWKNPRRNNPEYQNHLIQWRSQDSVERIDRPTIISRARALGYKAKQGVVVIRSKIRKGGRKREGVHRGRKPGNAGKVHYSPKKNLRTISEIRANKRYPNLTVLNSYEVGDDGKYKWFEVILIDTNNPQIFNDRHYKKLCLSKNRGRVHRGLTSAGKKGRGLRNKGKGAEKLRPSIRAHNTLGK